MVPEKCVYKTSVKIFPYLVNDFHISQQVFVPITKGRARRARRNTTGLKSQPITSTLLSNYERGNRWKIELRSRKKIMELYRIIGDGPGSSAFHRNARKKFLVRAVNPININPRSAITHPKFDGRKKIAGIIESTHSNINWVR